MGIPGAGQGSGRTAALVVSVLVAGSFVAFAVQATLVERAWQAEHEQILREGAATTGLVEGRYVIRPDSESRPRYALLVRFYTDGTAGPPQSSDSQLPGFGRSGLPPGLGAGGAGLPFDIETTMENGRIVGRPICESRMEVSSAFYEETQVGGTVPVKYLVRDPSRFVVVGAEVPGHMAWMWMIACLAVLAIGWRLWRVFVR